MSNTRIVVCSCSLGHVTPDWLNPYIDLLQHPDILARCHTQGTLLPQARNGVLEKLKFKEFTHVFFIDSDMVDFTALHLDKLIKADKDIISAVAVMRRPPYAVCAALPHELRNAKNLLKAKDPIEVKHTGMAFTLIKISVLEAIQENTPAGPIWFNADRFPDLESSQIKLNQIAEEFNNNNDMTGKNIEEYVRKFGMNCFMAGTVAHIGTDMVGEDIGFCWRVKQHGFSVWVHPDVHVGHQGEKTYTIQDQLTWNKKQKKSTVFTKKLIRLSFAEQEEAALV